MIEVYLPSLLIMAVSWLSFMIPFELTAPRTTMNITTVLTQTTMWMAIDRWVLSFYSKPLRNLLVLKFKFRTLPASSSTVKAIDVWKGFSLLFVYGALFEYGVMNFLHRVASDVSKKEKTYDKDRRHTILSISETATTLQQQLAQSKVLKIQHNQYYWIGR